MDGHQLEAFLTLESKLRTIQHDSIIRLDLIKEVDRPNLRVTTFLTPEEGVIPQAEENTIIDDDFSDFSPEEVFQGNDIIQDLHRRVDSFSDEQMQFFQDVKKTLETPDYAQYLAHVAAGAEGVGKSYLIECLSSLIKGTTLHLAFSIPIERFGSANYIALGPRKLQDMRNALRNLQWIIIDEISMVSYQTLRFIYLRLWILCVRHGHYRKWPRFLEKIFFRLLFRSQSGFCASFPKTYCCSESVSSSFFG
jgi:hypothetical protein